MVSPSSRTPQGGSPRGLRRAFTPGPRRVRGDTTQLRPFAGAFLLTAWPAGPVEVVRIHPREVSGFIGSLTGRYQPRTVELAATSLRSFFRFLRAAGLRADRLEDAVPMIPHRPAGLVRIWIPIAASLADACVRRAMRNFTLAVEAIKLENLRKLKDHYLRNLLTTTSSRPFYNPHASYDINELRKRDLAAAIDSLPFCTMYRDQL